MGLGSLRILPAKKVPYYKILDFFLLVGNSLEPYVCRLLWSLHRASCRDDFFSYHATIIDYGFSPLALVFIPFVLMAIATEVSFLMTCVTLNFTYVPSRTIRSSSLEESSLWVIPPLGYVTSSHRPWIYFFTPHYSSSGSSCQGVHCIWVCKLMS